MFENERFFGYNCLTAFSLAFRSPVVATFEAVIPDSSGGTRPVIDQVAMGTRGVHVTAEAGLIVPVSFPNTVPDTVLPSRRDLLLLCKKIKTNKN